MPFAVFWMRAHFVNMPRELSEAARVDGAGTWDLFWRIHVPLARPADRLARDPHVGLDVEPVPDRPRARRRSRSSGPSPARWAPSRGSGRTDIPLLCAGSILILLPTLIVFVIFQRQVITALLQGSVKG